MTTITYTGDKFLPENEPYVARIERLNMPKHSMTTYLLLFKGNWRTPAGTYIKINPKLFMP